MDPSLKVLSDAVREAGEAVAAMRKNGVTITLKSNHDVLTQADLLANQILKDRLLTAFPHDGWLSEESVDDHARLTHKRVWVVDPIDGTREYVAGVPEYAVSVALVEAGIPVLACVFNPETNELYTAERGAGAYLNEQRIHCRSDKRGKLILLASRSEYRRGEWVRFEQEEVRVIGSIAYKLALVASGVADATFSLGPKSEWDIAAGVLLITEAGGVVTDKSGAIFVFNQSNVLVNGIIATSTSAESRLLELIAG